MSERVCHVTSFIYNITDSGVVSAACMIYCVNYFGVVSASYDFYCINDSGVVYAASVSYSRNYRLYQSKLFYKGT